ncbi:hypothetical protein SprV_0702426500 [Sparganum proliferum]
MKIDVNDMQKGIGVQEQGIVPRTSYESTGEATTSGPPPRPVIIAEYLSSALQKRIKPQDLSLPAKLDEIMCGILCGVFGMSVNPEWRLNYFSILSSLFRKIGYDVPIGLTDISDDREPRKWLRMLSYCIEFIRRTTYAGDLASRVIDDTERSANAAQAYATRIAALRVSVEGQRTKTAEYREKINLLTSEYSKASDHQKQVESHLQAVKLKLESLNASATRDSGEADRLRDEVVALEERKKSLELQVISDPDKLPELVENLLNVVNDSERQITELFANRIQITQSITKYRKVTSMLDEEMDVDVTAFFSAITKTTDLQSELETVKKTVADLAEDQKNECKVLTELADAVNLLESSLVSQKLHLTNHDELATTTKAKMTADLDKVRSEITRAQSNLNKLEALLKTTKALYDEGISKSKLNESIQVKKKCASTLKTLFDLYNAAVAKQG